jgi:hypothetical protein
MVQGEGVDLSPNLRQIRDAKFRANKSLTKREVPSEQESYEPLMFARFFAFKNRRNQ